MCSSRIKLEDFRRYDENCSPRRQKLFAKTTKIVRQDDECHADDHFYASLIAHLADKFIPIAHSNASEDPLGDAVIKVL